MRAGAWIPVLVGAIALTAWSLTTCREADRKRAVVDAAAREPVRVEPDTWTIDDTYPVTVRRSFRIVNETADRVSVVDMLQSCGCIASGLAAGVEIPPSAVHVFDLSVDFSHNRGPVSHTIQFVMSDGRRLSLAIAAHVKRGAFAEPVPVVIEGQRPGELVTRVVRVQCDDQAPFEITDARLACAEELRIDNTARTVTLTVRHANTVPSVLDVLSLRLSHPRVSELYIPVQCTFTLSWESRPPVVFIHGGTEPVIERSVIVRSLDGRPFVVHADASEVWEIVPSSEIPAASQQVTLRVRRPSIPDFVIRHIVELRTTLSDAPVVHVPVVFYPETG